MEAPPTHGSLAGFTPRQSSYLRISPTLVLQLILYLEPHHVEWMNVRTFTVFPPSFELLYSLLSEWIQVGVFERILVALKDRIPLKLQMEEIGRASKSSSGKQKREKVDVFRGSKFISSSLSLYVHADGKSWGEWLYITQRIIKWHSSSERLMINM